MLHSIEQMLVLPPRYPSLRPCRARRFERTILTGSGPVAPDPLAIFFATKAIWQLLPSRTAVGVLLRQIDKVLLTEAPFRLCAGSHRLGQGYRDASLVAGEDLHTTEVAAIGNGIERIGLQHGLRLLGHIGQLRSI